MRSKQKFIEVLVKHISDIEPLIFLDKRDASFRLKLKQWERSTLRSIMHIFGDNSGYVDEFKDIDFYDIHSYETSGKLSGSPYNEALNDAKALLKSMIDEINSLWEDENISGIKNKKQTHKNEIFVIHGHDDKIKLELKELLKDLELSPIVLLEQVNGSRTVIEKFEEYSNVSSAIALLTPDDIGKKRSKTEKTRFRARQNVIFELGYFMGKIGRHRVISIIKGDIEMPSDLKGYTTVEIKPNDCDDWKINLIKELKSLGFNINANKFI